MKEIEPGRPYRRQAEEITLKEEGSYVWVEDGPYRLGLAEIVLSSIQERPSVQWVLVAERTKQHMDRSDAAFGFALALTTSEHRGTPDAVAAEAFSRADAWLAVEGKTEPAPMPLSDEDRSEISEALNLLSEARRDLNDFRTELEKLQALAASEAMRRQGPKEPEQSQEEANAQAGAKTPSADGSAG